MVRRAEGLAAAQIASTPEPAAQITQNKSRTEKTKKSVYIYIATLFLVVLLCTLLSYFMQQRSNSEISTLSERNATAQMNIENLQSTTLRLQSDNAAYQKQVSDLQAQITDLESQIREIRQSWQADVQNVISNDRAAYNELLAKYDELALKNGDKVKK